MFSKVLLCCDFLMTRPETQRYHLRWLSTILNTPLQRALMLKPADFLSDQVDTFSRRVFFAKSGIILNEAESHFHFTDNAITDDSIQLLQETLSDSLLIGYELSEETRHILNRAGLTYIDIWLHPIRFLDDNFFAFRSNDNNINNVLQSHHLSDEVYTLYADKLKIQSYMGWDRYKNGLDNNLKANSALFVGQTLTDKAVCRNGTMLNVLNFKEEFTALTKQFSHVYFSRHPMIKGDDTAQLDFVLSHENTSITTEPGYKLLCTDSIEHLTGVSSSLMYESKFFGKSFSYLYRPVLEIFDNETQHGYFSIFSKLHSPTFWKSALEQLLPTKPTTSDYCFLSNTSNYRDMLALYYNTHVFDKNHASFVESIKPKTSGHRKKSTPEDSKYKFEKLQANPPSLRKVELAIDEHDVISFDVFDTLLQRKTWVPGDVINLTAHRAHTELGITPEDFINARREAKKHSTKNEVPLTERYEIIGRILKLDTLTTSKLYAFEIEIEEGLLEARTIGKLAFEYAKSQDKRVIVTSDTYFTESQIGEFLACAGMVPDAIYASSTYDATKENGDLYKVLLEQEPEKTLHIGDNYKADITNSSKYKISSNWIISNHDQFKGSTPQFVKSTGPYGAIKNGLIQRTITNFPSITQGAGYTSGKPFNLGYSIVGDMMLAFAAWIVEKARIDKVETLYFLARDGEIVKKVADELLSRIPGNTVKTKYLLASRRSTRVVALHTPNDVLAEVVSLASEYENNANRSNLEEYLTLRFGLSVSEFENLGLREVKEAITASTDAAEASAILADWLNSTVVTNAVLDNAEVERTLYTDYLDSEGFVQSSFPIGIVDIGHNGSLQASLAKTRGLSATRGYYFCTYDGVDSTLAQAEGDHQATGFYRDRISTSDRAQKYIRYALIIEALFLNEKGTFLRFNLDQGLATPTYLDGNENARVAFNQEIHAGSLQYTKDLLDTVECCFKVIEPGHLWMHDDVCSRLFSMLETPMYRDAEVFSGITIENYFAGRPLRYFVPPKTNLSVTPVLWKEGTAALKSGIEMRKNLARERKKSEASAGKINSRTDLHKQFVDLERAANSLFREGNYIQAAQAFEKAYKSAPDKPNLMRAASEAYLLGKDRRSAISALKTARRAIPRNKKLARRLLAMRFPILKIMLGDNKFKINTNR